MPYRRAYLWVLLLFPAVALAFWPSYFSRLESVSWILHAHGVTASFWIALVAVQSWSIHREARSLHKLAGRSSLALFSIFWSSGLLIIQFMAAGFVARDNPFHSMFGARLTAVDIITSAAVLYLYYIALAHRRAVLVHASAMLAILFFLIPPIAVRLLQIAGPFAIHGPSEFYKFGLGLHFSNALAVIAALWLYSRRPRSAWPFLVAGVAIALQSLVFETLGKTAAWEGLMPLFSAVHLENFAAGGLIVSAGVVAFAWFRGSRGTSTRRKKTQRAAVA